VRFRNAINHDNWLGNTDRVRFVAVVKPYTPKELCRLYSVTAKTFYKWLAPFHHELGSRIGYYYTIKQVELIFLNLGVPYVIEEE